MSRAFDGPIGDPFGGPAYGKREMPAVAVAGAVWGGAALAGIGMAAVTGFAAVAAVGAVMAGVGVLVGSPELTKLGGVVGLAGGIGSLGAGQGWWSDIGAGTEALGTGTDVMSGGSAETTSVAQAAIDTPTVGGVTVDVPTVNLDASVMGSDSSVLADSLRQPSGSALLTQEQVLANRPGLMPSPAGQQFDMLNTQPRNMGAPAFSLKGTGDLGNLTGAPPLPGGGTELGIWDKMLGFANKNPEIMKMGFTGLTEAGKALYASDAEDAAGSRDAALAEYYASKTDAERQQMANAGYAPNVTKQFALTPGLTPFRTPRPAFGTPKPVGLIGSR